MADNPTPDRAAQRAVSAMSELDALRTTNEEGGLLLAELTTAFAANLSEPLKPCVDPCPGHLGEKGMAAVNEALARWDALRAQLQQAEERARAAEESRGELLRALEVDSERIAALKSACERLANEADFVDLNVLSNARRNPNGYRLLRHVEAARTAIANAQAATRAAQPPRRDDDPVHQVHEEHSPPGGGDPGELSARALRDALEGLS
jgi:hypothetical protein